MTYFLVGAPESTARDALAQIALRVTEVVVETSPASFWRALRARRPGVIALTSRWLDAGALESVRTWQGAGSNPRPPVLVLLESAEPAGNAGLPWLDVDFRVLPAATLSHGIGAELTASLTSLLKAGCSHADTEGEQPRSAHPQRKASLPADTKPTLVGTSPAMMTLRRQIEAASRFETAVVIHGPTGSGKEMVAREIHARSRRASSTFLPLNVATLTPELATSTLFGHERGSFTGASAVHRGVFERASHGRLLLDEIAELPLALQAQLLRVLEEGRVWRIGAESPRDVDVVVIAASSRRLEMMVESKTFREDLYYRLAGLRLEVPSLRERAEDIPALVAYYAPRLAERAGYANAPEFHPGAIAALQQHSWPGNVRELIAAVSRAIVASIELGHATISADHVSAAVQWKPPEPRLPPTIMASSGGSLRDRLRTLEEQSVREALKHARGNIRRAARAVGDKPTTFRSRMQRLGVEAGDRVLTGPA